MEYFIELPLKHGCVFKLIIALFIHRHYGSHRNHWLSILSRVGSGFVVSTVAKNGLQLEEIFHKSTVTFDERIFGRPLHICIILDIFIRNGSCLLIGFRII